MSRVKLYALVGILLVIGCYSAAAHFCDPAPRTSGSGGSSARGLVPDERRDAGPKGRPTDDGSARGDARMDGLAAFAGFFAAHGIWCVSDDEMLVPMLAWEDAGGKRNLERHEGENREAHAAAMAQLEKNSHGAARGVVVVDGYVTVDGVRRDAVIVEARQYGEPKLRLQFTIPYRTKASGGFGVYRPMVGTGSGEGWGVSRETGPEIDAFLRGVKSHEKGFTVWEAKRIGP